MPRTIAQLYDLVEPRVARVADRVLREAPANPAVQASYMIDTARRILGSAWGQDALRRDDSGAGVAEIEPTMQYMEVLERHASAFLNGSMDGDAVFQEAGGALWARFQRQDPIACWWGDHMVAALAAFLSDARVLEIGGGSGGTTVRLAHALASARSFLFTDVYEPFLQRISSRLPPETPLTTATLNVNRLPEDQEAFDAFDVVYATNVLHIAHDPVAVLTWIRQHLAGDGIVVLAEGSPYSERDPWPLELLFALLPAWRDVPATSWRPRPGFLTPGQWRYAMTGAGLACSDLVLSDGERCFGGIYTGWQGQGLARR